MLTTKTLRKAAVYVYPPRISGLADLDWETRRKLPEAVRRMYAETRDALLAKTYVLAAAGLRGVVEAICVSADVQGRTLEARIDGLAERGLLTTTQADYLHAHRFYGNDALHDFTPPKPKDLTDAFNVLTHVLHVMYALPDAPERLKEIRASREKGKGEHAGAAESE